MGDSILRKHIREILFEFFNNSWVYTYGPNKFPKFDGTETTPSVLDVEFDSEFNFMHDELEESENNVGLEKSCKKKSIIPNKH